MKVYLVRHALAEDHNPAGDAARALTPKGRFRMTEEAKGLRKLGVAPGVILSSPMRRALETAAILHEGLGGIQVEEMAELGRAAAGPADILSALRAWDKCSEVMLVGHQPWLGELASFLLTGSGTECQIELKKGAVVCLERATTGSDRFVLTWSLPPKVLRSV